jgi:hypothetical protein
MSLMSYDIFGQSSSALLIQVVTCSKVNALGNSIKGWFGRGSSDRVPV